MIIIYLALGLAGIMVYTNIRRARLRYSFRLLPNCLITRKPLLFISGKKSLFYFLSYWNFIPQLLREHGYEVIELHLPWRRRQLREKALMQFFNQQGTDFHVIGDITTETELISICNQLAKTPQVWIITNQDQQLTKFKNLNRISFMRESHKQATGLSKLAFWVHQKVVKSRLSPSVLGVPNLSDPNQLAHQYLNFAISLAVNEN